MNFNMLWHWLRSFYRKEFTLYFLFHKSRTSSYHMYILFVARRTINLLCGIPTFLELKQLTAFMVP